jgi:DNA-binding response OmpR family regulator
MEPMRADYDPILLAEDDPELRALVKEALVAAGFEVVEAENGKEALEILLSREPISLVISDLSMPVMTGRQLVDLMQSYSRLSRIPIVVVSSEPEGSTVIHGIHSYLQKPFDIVVLLAAVEACLRGHAFT